MGGVRVLVVDDHPNVRVLMASVLMRMGHEVDTAPDGLRATRMLRGSSYDLVLTDLKMPKMDGIKLLRYTKEHFPQTDVMMITAHATIESAVEATKLGAYDYITKPFNVDELQLRVRNWAEARALRRKTEHLSAVVSLTRLSHTLTGNLDLESLSGQIVTLVNETFGADHSSLVLVESSDADGADEPQVSLLGATRDWAGQDRVTSQVLSQVIKTRRPWLGPVEVAGASERAPAISIPLRHRDKVVGVLSLARNPGESPYTQEDVQLLSVFGAQIAIALENARAYRELREVSIGTITALVTAVEARDPYTKGHSERVAKYSASVARQIGLPPGQVEDLRVAGLLHDIGKIGISDLILNKKGSLTRDEYEVVKEHPRIGARIVEEIKPLQRIVPLIYHHHERYDGSGYPDGLAGNDIPLGARILAVADAFEAMTSRRAYRSNLGIERSLELLEAGAGGQLDPQLVGVFKRLWLSGQLQDTAFRDEQGCVDENVPPRQQRSQGTHSRR